MRLELKLVVLACLGCTAAQTDAMEFTPSGRLHLDYAFHEADVAPLGNKFLVRRAQFGLDGKINDDWSAQIAYDFTGNGEFKDVYLRYEGWKPGAFTIGQFKVPFGLEELSSSNDITFIERSLPSTAFAPARRMGIGFDRTGKHHTFTAMGFGQSIGGNEGRGAAARLTFAPIDRRDTLVHLGLSASTEQVDGNASFSTRPESFPTDIRLVRTGNLGDIGRVDQLGLEGAWRTGPFSAQTEWMHSDLSPRSGQPNVNFHGWYVGGSWALTGESREYRHGVFKGISPGKAGGAWELTARYSRISLDDGLVLGGNEDDLTLGLNWYTNDYLRIMANYIKVNSDRRGVSDDPNIVLVRAQVAF